MILLCWCSEFGQESQFNILNLFFLQNLSFFPIVRCSEVGNFLLRTQKGGSKRGVEKGSGVVC